MLPCLVVVVWLRCDNQGGGWSTLHCLCKDCFWRHQCWRGGACVHDSLCGYDVPCLALYAPPRLAELAVSSNTYTSMLKISARICTNQGGIIVKLYSSCLWHACSMGVFWEAPPVTRSLEEGEIWKPRLCAWIHLAMNCPSTMALTSTSGGNSGTGASLLSHLNTPWPAGMISGSWK